MMWDGLCVILSLIPGSVVVSLRVILMASLVLVGVVVFPGVSLIPDIRDLVLLCWRVPFPDQITGDFCFADFLDSALAH